MVTSNAIQQHQQQSVAQTDGDKMVQVAEAYSYLSDQKEINLDSIPLPLSPPPPLPSSTQSSPQAAAEQSANSTRPSCKAASTCGAYTFNILDTVDSFEVLEQTIIKQKRLARFKNTDLRRKILLKRTFDLVCEIMDHENGFDFEDEAETINKKPEPTTKSSDDDEDDDSSSSDSDSDSSDDDSDDDDEDSDSSSSDSSSSDEEDELPRPSDRRRGEIDQLIPSRPSESRSSALNSWDQAKTPLEPTAASSESKGLSSFANSDSQVLVIATQPPFSVLIHQRSEEDLDFTELNSIDISDNYDDSAFNLQDQVTYAADDDDCHSSSQSLKRKRNSFEETVHQNEQDLFNSSNSSSVAEQSTSDQQILCANPSLASLSDSTCFYNNQPPLRPSTLKRPSDDHQESTGVKRLKLAN